MSDLCVPNSALESPEEFYSWYMRMSLRLFPDIQKVYVPQLEEKFIIGELKKTFERVLSWANFIYNNDWSIVPYKNKEGQNVSKKCKVKGATSSITDIISVTVNIIISNYNIIQQKLATVIGVDRSSITYYIKRHHANCMYKDYLKKYYKLLTSLRDEGIISTVEEV